MNKETDKLLQWKHDLDFQNLDQLLLAAVKPTLIVPSNITFYPIRSSDNLLLKSVEWLSNGLSPRQTEELLVEGNIMFRDTDMDVRMGKAIDPYHVWNRWNHDLLELVSSEFNTLDEVFALHDAPKNWKQKLLGFYFKKNALATRDQYMQDIYANVTINLSHLASTLIMHYIGNGQYEIDKQLFYRCLYLAIKLLQKNKTIKLHRNLLNPDYYSDLLPAKNKRFESFIKVAEQSGLLDRDDYNFYFNDSLRADYNAYTIRMENLIAVYHNEASPILAVRKAIAKALAKAKKNTPKKLAQCLFEDELLSLQLDREYFTRDQYNEINQNEKATANPEPFFLQPNKGNGFGVLLIHGLLASPAEVADYGAELVNQGYTVIGVRVKGHGTSPYDLRSRTVEDWYNSIDRSAAILKLLCNKIIIIGFSTGGALALQYAAQNNDSIASVVAVAVPINFVDSSLMLVPLLHRTNKLVQWLSSYEGVKPFIHNDPENPEINYQAVPVRSLYELRRLIQEMLTSLEKIKVPTLLVYADQDPIVAINSADIILKKLHCQHKELNIIHSDQHGILMHNLAGTWATINKFISHCGLAKDTDTNAAKMAVKTV
jgi:esterase/lipase